VQEKARQPEPALNLPSEPGAAESIEPAQVPVETAVEERVEQPDAGLEVSSEPQVAAEPAVEERAQQLEPAPDLLSESPEAASTEPIESATELEAADAPAVQLTSAEQRDGETDQETSIAAAAAVPDVPLIAIVDTKSPPRIPRYVAIVGALGLLIGASLAIFYGPQSNSAAQHTSSVQLEPIPLPTQPATASQPKPVENANAAKKDTPTRPVSAPLRHDVVAQTVRRQPQRVDAPRLAAPAVPAPVVQLNSDKAIRNSSAMAGNKPAQSEGELPPALTPADAGKPAPIATIVRAPVPTPVLAPPRGPVRVSEGVVRGRAISQAKPIYPQAALNTRIQGSVVLNATIGTDGTIKKLQVVTGNPYLAGAALDAVKKWRYQPYYLDGVPVEVESTITLNFRLP
jgi:TonB family protein